MKIWLDDERPAPNGWKRCTSPGEAICLLQTGEVTEISLDHDLGLIDQTGEQTGYDVLLWLEARAARGLGPTALMRVHSANPVARRRMEQAIKAIRHLTEGGGSSAP